MILGFGGGVDGGCSRMEISRLKRLAGTKHAQQSARFRWGGGWESATGDYLHGLLDPETKIAPRPEGS